MNSNTSPLPTLEQSLAQITELIDKMEHNESTLDQSLQDFERGVTLIKHCQQLLKEAELKVNVLTELQATSELLPYEKDEKNDKNNKNNEDKA